MLNLLRLVQWTRILFNNTWIVQSSKVSSIGHDKEFLVLVLVFIWPWTYFQVERLQQWPGHIAQNYTTRLDHDDFRSSSWHTCVWNPEIIFTWRFKSIVKFYMICTLVLDCGLHKIHGGRWSGPCIALAKQRSAFPTAMSCSIIKLNLHNGEWIFWLWGTKESLISPIAVPDSPLPCQPFTSGNQL